MISEPDGKIMFYGGKEINTILFSSGYVFNFGDMENRQVEIASKIVFETKYERIDSWRGYLKTPEQVGRFVKVIDTYTGFFTI